jgi:hypothetical protein
MYPTPPLSKLDPSRQMTRAEADAAEAHEGKECAEHMLEACAEAVARQLKGIGIDDGAEVLDLIDAAIAAVRRM